MIRYAEHWKVDPVQLLSASCKLGLEGLISKRANSEYESGRSANWIKSKCTKAQEFVIGGYSHPKGLRKGFGALLLGVFEKSGALQYVGRVGTGFSGASISELMKKMKPLMTKQSPFTGASNEGDVTWLEPELVANVNFTEWTSEGSLRHPSFQGLREDKSATEVRAETPRLKRSKAKLAHRTSV